MIHTKDHLHKSLPCPVMNPTNPTFYSTKLTSSPPSFTPTTHIIDPRMTHVFHPQYFDFVKFKNNKNNNIHWDGPPSIHRYKHLDDFALVSKTRQPSPLSRQILPPSPTHHINRKLSQMTINDVDIEPVILTRCMPKHGISTDKNDCQQQHHNKEEVTLATLYKNKIFVGSLCRMTTPGELASFFKKFGIVTEAKVVLDDKGNSRGYGFVTFSNVDSVNAVLTAGSIFLRNRRIAVATAIRKKHPDED